MSVYRTVTVTPTLSENQVSVTPAITKNVIPASGNMVNETIVSSTDEYPALNNKPQIESVELVGNKSFKDLGLSQITNMQIEQIIKF